MGSLLRIYPVRSVLSTQLSDPSSLSTKKMAQSTSSWTCMRRSNLSRIGKSFSRYAKQAGKLDQTPSKIVPFNSIWVFWTPKFIQNPEIPFWIFRKQNLIRNRSQIGKRSQTWLTISRHASTSITFNKNKVTTGIPMMFSRALWRTSISWIDWEDQFQRNTCSSCLCQNILTEYRGDCNVNFALYPFCLPLQFRQR